MYFKRSFMPPATKMAGVCATLRQFFILGV